MRKKAKIINCTLTVLLILQSILPVTANIGRIIPQTEASSIGTFDITVTPNSEGYGSVTIDWNDYDYTNKVFKVYKKEDGKESFETVGIDYTMVEQVKCLQIYPIVDAKNQLKDWMETNGYGKGLIKIDSVFIDSYNANPNRYLKDSNGKYKYDVILIGTWDANMNKDLNENSKVATEQFIKSGRGCVVGHDTLGYRPNIDLLSPYFGITGGGDTGGGNKVKIEKTGIITNYPWNIGDIGTILTVPSTHTYGQNATNADIWLSFDNKPQNSKNFYLASKNNCAMIQTGHSNGQATEDEQKILANTIFFLNQLIHNTHLTTDSSAQDFANPNAPVVSTKGMNLTFTATDNGTHYKYYVESYKEEDTSQTGLIAKSTEKDVTVTTGAKEYCYILDNVATTEINENNGTKTSSNSIPINTKYEYLHVAAIDGAGNMGKTTHYKIPKTASYTVNYYEMNEDRKTYKLKDTYTKTETIGSEVTPTIEDVEGFVTPETQKKQVLADGSLVINYYYDRIKPKTANYTVNHYLMNSDGKTYKLKDTYTSIGNIGEEVEPSVEYIEGFITPETQKGIILEYGSLVINYYYDRIFGTGVIKIIDEETKEIISGLDIEAINKKTGEIIKAVETKEGYVLEKIEPGDYIIKEKTPEGYKEINNIEMKIEEGEKTEIKNIEHKRLIHDMKVETKLESITINGKKKKPGKGNIHKIEIPESQIETEDIKLEYVIQVSNVGEIKSTIGEIIEKVPKGFKVISEGWKEEDGQAIWDATTEELNPGESKEVRITLQWENSPLNLGENKNIVLLKGGTNSYNYEDKNTNNDLGEETILLSIKTGSEENVKIMIIIIIIIDIILVTCIAIYLKITKRRYQT